MKKELKFGTNEILGYLQANLIKDYKDGKIAIQLKDTGPLPNLNKPKNTLKAQDPSTSGPPANNQAGAVDLGIDHSKDLGPGKH